MDRPQSRVRRAADLYLVFLAGAVGLLIIAGSLAFRGEWLLAGAALLSAPVVARIGFSLSDGIALED